MSRIIQLPLSEDEYGWLKYIAEATGATREMIIRMGLEKIRREGGAIQIPPSEEHGDRLNEKSAQLSNKLGPLGMGDGGIQK